MDAVHRLTILKEEMRVKNPGDLGFILAYLITSLKTLLACILMNIDLSIPTVLTTLGLVLIVSSFSYLFERHKRKYFLFLLNLIISIVLLADCLYYRYFNVPITVYTLLQVTNLQGLGGSVTSLFKLGDLLFLLDLPFMFFLYSAAPAPAGSNKRAFVVMLASGMLITFTIPLLLFVAEVNPFRRYDATGHVRFYGPLGHHVLDTAYFFRDRNISLTPQEKNDIKLWFAGKEQNQSNLISSSFKSIGKGQNLIMIQVESLQNFVINQKIDGESITPNLNGLLKYSIYFPNFYPQTVEGNSSDAELLVNTSLYPVQKGSTFFRYPENKYHSLAWMLKKENYSTIAIHGDERTYWNRDKVYPNLGFDSFKSLEDFKLGEKIGMGLSDHSMFRQSIPILKETDSPFFAFIITLTSHMPFEMPKEKENLNLSAPVEDTLLGNYLQSINYADRAIGYFLDRLKENALLENSIIVIYGDHDGMRDEEEIEKLCNRRISKEEWIRKYTPVPLIIYNPSLEGQEMEIIGGQVDLLPTLAYLMGIGRSEYEKYAMGQNLLTTRKGFAMLPSGDYEKRELYITKQQIKTTFDSHQREMLRISDLVIRSDFYVVQD